MAEFEKMNLASADLVADRIEKLKQLLPEVTTEGGIDFDKLRLVLGDEVDEGTERYAFTWPGKADAIRQSQTPSTATLRPCPEESVNWDETENLYIEGDNLEVLKLLQHSYHGRVKAIYIDPPYNTGKEFVYEDSFGDSVENYREQALLTNQSNADTSGRYHSRWCSMLYPRLRLARELLSDDGAIFISIDDYEVDNLMKIAYEIFGEANHVGTVIWERAFAPKNDAKYFSASHDYILVFAKSIGEFNLGLLPRTEEANARYKNPDNDPRGPWAADNMTVRTYSAAYDYPITTPNGTVISPTNGRCWFTSKERMMQLIAEGRVWFGEDGGNTPRIKRYLADVQQGMTPITIWKYEDVGHNQEGRQELKKLFGGKGYFDSPKPLRLLDRILQVANLSGDEIVLDFFSGSATTAHAVMRRNAENASSNRFIMVQLPEPVDNNSDAYADGFRTLCDIGIERIRRAGHEVAERIEEDNRQLRLGQEPKLVPDIGFRVLKLDESGIERPKPGELVLDVVKPDRSDEDIIFEMMLKWGLELTLPIEKVDAAGYPCYSVAYGELVCCLAPGLNMQVLDAIADMDPRRVLMLDRNLDDTTKLNAVQAFKRVEERTGREVELRTV